MAPDNGTVQEKEWRLGAFDGLSIVAGRPSRLQQRVDERFNVYEKRDQEKNFIIISRYICNRLSISAVSRFSGSSHLCLINLPKECLRGGYSYIY